MPGRWPDQTLDQAFGLSEVLVAVSTSRLSLQEGQENANIDAGLGFIWKISVKANMHMMMKSFFVATALIAAASSAQAQSYNWNSRRIVVDPPTAAQRAAADEEARREEKARDAVGNTSGASTTASATTQASGGGINGSYSTTFPLTENPISEGGSWTNGGATGLGWANVQTTPGLSFGTGPINAGTYLYAVLIYMDRYSTEAKQSSQSSSARSPTTTYCAPRGSPPNHCSTRCATADENGVKRKYFELTCVRPAPWNSFRACAALSR